MFEGAFAMRVGEASNPGPPNTDVADDENCLFVLGTANVAGLSNKIDEFLNLPAGLWGLTETHLTHAGISTAKKAIGAGARRDHRLVRALPGASVAPRVQDSVSGTWSGVMWCSDFPSRRLNVPWRGGEFDSGRVVMTASFVQQHQITGATIYGAAQGPTFQDPLKITGDILSTITEELVNGMRGPRYILGDLNVKIDQLPHMSYWHSKGWRELQIHAWEAWHYPVQPTCKMATVRDFVWVSPELLRFLIDVEVKHFVFPDHSVVMGQFRVPGSSSSSVYWAMPHTIPWDQVNRESWRAACEADCVPFAWGADHTRDFQVWSQQVEMSLQGFVPTDNGRLPPGCCGRGMPVEIEQELLSLWRPRWQNSEHLDESRWSRILAFAHHYMPRYVIEEPSLDSMDVTDILRRGDSLRTRGPDGWSSRDLIELPPGRLRDLVALLQRIEGGHDWPLQLVRGHVHCLEKEEGATEAAQFRPVVLYSLIYRIWGSLRSRFLLGRFAALASFPAFGFLKGRSCQHATYLVMAMVEHALKMGETRSGFLTDIIKCFNFLPRGPLLKIARQLGVSRQIVSAWQSFLKCMTRSFVIQNQPGQPCPSWAGFPEGDSMSCVAMVVADFCFHYYMMHYRPTWTTISFVDNLEGIGDTAAEAVMSFLTTETWADTLGLALDQKKTCFWSLDPEQRGLLRSTACR